MSSRTSLSFDEPVADSALPNALEQGVGPESHSLEPYHPARAIALGEVRHVERLVEQLIPRVSQQPVGKGEARDPSTDDQSCLAQCNRKGVGNPGPASHVRPRVGRSDGNGPATIEHAK